MCSLHLMRNFDAIICQCVTSLTSSHLLHVQHLVVRTPCCFCTPFGHISWLIRSLLPHTQDSQQPWLALRVTVCEHTEWHLVSHLADPHCDDTKHGECRPSGKGTTQWWPPTTPSSSTGTARPCPCCARLPSTRRSKPELRMLGMRLSHTL